MDVVEFISNNVWYTAAVSVFVIVLLVKCCLPHCRCNCNRKKALLKDYDKDVEMKSVAPDVHPRDIPTDCESDRSLPEEESLEEEPHTVYVDVGMQTDPPVRRNNIVKVSLRN